MAGDPNAGARSPAVQSALSVVDLGRQATTAYARPDLVGAPRDHAQAAGRPGVPRVRHRRVQAGQVVAGQRAAQRPGLPGRRRHRHVRADRHPLRRPARGRGAVRPGRRSVRPRPRADPRGDRGRPGRRLRHRGGRPRRASGRCSSVEVSLPRKLLSDGLVIVDTPGVGGLGSAHSAATIGALPMADAVVFVSDASQEFTGPELEFLQTARRMCPNVVCVLTKIDFYPAWRKIRDLNVGPPRRARASRPRSCACRRRCASTPCAPTTASSTASRASPQLASYLQNTIAANAERLSVRAAANDVVAVAAMLESQFQSERQALDDPDQAQQVVANLTEAKAKAERLQERRVEVAADAERRRDRPAGRRRPRPARPPPPGDPPGRRGPRGQRPGETWDEFEAWLYRRVAEDVVHNYTFLHDRAQELDGPGRRALRRGRRRHRRRPRRRQPHRGAHHASTPTPTSTCARWASAPRAWPRCGAATAACSCSACSAAWPAWPWPTRPRSSSACSWAARP